MIKEVIEDALARGEKLKHDIVGQILKSATLSELINNRRFTETVARVIQTKDEIGRVIQKTVHEALRAMKIPTREQIAGYERRVQMLEKKVSRFDHRLTKPTKTRK